MLNKVYYSSFFYGTKLLNFIAHQYLFKLYTICIIWNPDYNFQPSFNSFNAAGCTATCNRTVKNQDHIPKECNSKTNRNFLQIVSLSGFADFEDLCRYLTDSIEKSFCEGFIVFGSDIPEFLNAYVNASQVSDRRYPRNHFVLVSEQRNKLDQWIFNHDVIRDHPDFLYIEQLTDNNEIPHKFNLWTSKFVSPENNTENMFLDSYDGLSDSFSRGANLFPDKISNQQGRPLRLATFNYKPYTIVVQKSDEEDDDEGKNKNIPAAAAVAGSERMFNAVDMADNSKVILDGTEGRLMTLFCEKLNCSLHLELDQEGEWGTLYDNYSGTGMFGNLISRNAEVAIGALYLWYHEYLYFQYSKPISRTGITALVPHPRQIASWLLPVQPFSWELWTGTIVTLAMSSLALHLTLKRSERINLLDNPPYFLQGPEIILRTFLAQSSTFYTRLTSIRMIFFSSFVIGLLLTSAYSGGLSSILTVPSFEEPIDNIQQIAERHLRWAATSPAWIYTIQHSPDPTIQKALGLFELLSEEDMRVKSYTKKYGFTIERLPYGHFAIGDHITEEAAEFLQMMLTDIYYEYCILMSFKTWPMMEHFDELVLRIQQSGIQSYWEMETANRYLNFQIQLKVALSRLRNLGAREAKSFQLINALGMIIIWTIGITISATIFVLELIFYKKKN